MACSEIYCSQTYLTTDYGLDVAAWAVVGGRKKKNGGPREGPAVVTPRGRGGLGRLRLGPERLHEVDDRPDVVLGEALGLDPGHLGRFPAVPDLVEHHA